LLGGRWGTVIKKLDRGMPSKAYDSAYGGERGRGGECRTSARGNISNIRRKGRA